MISKKDFTPHQILVGGLRGKKKYQDLNLWIKSKTNKRKI